MAHFGLMRWWKCDNSAGTSWTGTTRMQNKLMEKNKNGESMVCWWQMLVFVLSDFAYNV